MHLKPILKGLLTYVPGLMRLARGRTLGTDSARYCYSVWLRHLVHAARQGVPMPPRALAELGPGDSLGIGLAALLSGSDRYLAFDIVRYAPSERNLRILDELVELFRARAPIPDANEFPHVHPALPEYTFPSDVLDTGALERALGAERLAAIRRALAGEPAADEISIDYRVPWDDVEEPESLDLVLSQACLEHVDKLEAAYAAMHRWLRPGGAISHEIDFKSHGITPEWDGHWQYPAWLWKIVRGRRPYLLNRAPLSVHLRLIERHFEVRACDADRREPESDPDRLAPPFRELSATDRTATSVYILAVKRPDAPPHRALPRVEERSARE